MTLWALEWRSKNRLDGERRHLILWEWDWPDYPRLFRTRKEAREYRDAKYGYIRERQDLRAEPHGWRLPQPVKVGIAKVESATPLSGGR